jgi:hypothetical protein
MEPIYDGTNASGLLKVWNATKGYLDVSTEGHLLIGETTAWVEETPEIISLIEKGLLILVEGQTTLSSSEIVTPTENAKKKRSSTVTNPSSTSTEDQPAADETVNKNDDSKIEPSDNDVSVETV